MWHVCYIIVSTSSGSPVRKQIEVDNQIKEKKAPCSADTQMKNVDVNMKHMSQIYMIIRKRKVWLRENNADV